MYKDYIHYYLFTLQNKEVHVHSDFLLYINDREIDLTADRYQSSASSTKHAFIHLHDGFDNVVHRHKEDITFVSFLESLGFIVTNSCIALETKEQFCTDEDSMLRLYVNGKPITDIEKYVTQEEDQIFLYYGNKQSSQIQEQINAVTEDSCLYSGTCPEKGEPPAESCGLTCEI